ncbi:MAG: M23 family metallopeptidase [Patescibacteria group bacterium]
MSKKRLAYKTLLLFLKFLILVKRGLARFSRTIWRGLIILDSGYRKKIGFPIYKFIFHLKKKFTVVNVLRKYSFMDLIGERGLLQAILLLTLLFLAFPHSSLHARSNLKVPGENTLLYKIVGPGELDYSPLEEVYGSDQALAPTESAKPESWKSGSVVVSPSGNTAGGQVQPEMAGTAVGGSALVKPLIIPGAGAGTDGVGSKPSGRTAIVYYEVQPGDVIGAIAQRFGISVNSILWANGLSFRSYIRPGDKLKILPTDGVVYKVARGDTLQKIARLYQANADEIATFNNLPSSGKGLTIGLELIIPKGKQIIAVVPRPTIKSSILGGVVAPIPSISAPAGTGYLWPTAAGIITQYYGWRHTGLDIAGKQGLANYATKSGTVIKSQCGYNGGYGCYIIINHGNGAQSLYGHNSKLLVSVGDYVEQGQAIAILGNTGRSTGPHIHFEIRINGKRVNPLQYIRR